MQYNTIFSGAYQVGETLERSPYSLLCTGEQSSTGQPVLIRIWPKAQALLEEEQKRIHAEIEALQKLQHPHVLSVLDIYTTEHGIALVSPFLPVGTLNERLIQNSEDALSFVEAVQIIQQVGQALQTLHEYGITHGNLTPQAVGFTLPEQVGLGEFRWPSVLRCIHDYQPTLEEGVPHCLYMAPEQFLGIFDARGDQYALGCLAYVLFTGRVPFAGSTRAVVSQKHLHDLPTPLREINAALPPEAEAAVLKALAKEPDQRHNSVQAFLEALGQDSLADLETRKQPSIVIGLEQTIEPSPDSTVPPVAENVPVKAKDAKSLWDWDELANPSKPVLSAPSGNADQETVADLLPLAPVAIPTIYSSNAPQPGKRRYILIVSSFLLILILFFVFARLLPFANKPVQSQKITGIATSTTVLLTPVTGQTRPQLTPTGTVAAIQIPPTPTPAPAPTPTPTLAPTPTPTLTPANTVIPILDCVTQEGSSFLAKFGYKNSSPTPLTIPVGAKNSISPYYLNGSQPVFFSPGTQKQVFQIHFYYGMKLVWSLDGYKATASAQSPPC